MTEENDSNSNSEAVDIFSVLEQKRALDAFILRSYHLPIHGYLTLLEKILQESEMKERAWKAVYEEHLKTTTSDESTPDSESDAHVAGTLFFTQEYHFLRSLFLKLESITTQAELVQFKKQVATDETYGEIIQMKNQDIWLSAFVDWMVHVMQRMAFFFLDAPAVAPTVAPTDENHHDWEDLRTL